MTRKKKAVCTLLCIVLSLPYFGFNQTIQVFGASSRQLTLQQAESLALANNKKYKAIKNKIIMEQAKYSETVKSIALKKKNMRTFRWTPLLSFKFPEQATLADEYEWQYKPLQIQNEITSLNHQLSDVQCAQEETISNLFVKVYLCQEKISFTEERLEERKKNLTGNKARVIIGEAKQADIDKMEKSIEKLEADLVLLMRSSESLKAKVSDLIKLDVSTGYHFESPFVESNISREMLKEMIQYTLENDQTHYEAKLNMQLAYIGLNLNENLIRNQYGGKINYIQPFISQAKKGEEIDEAAFKNRYDQFLEEIDRPWQGSYRILFIKIPKEWFKGSIDGVRYVEDDPYALYTSTLEYANAKEEKESVEKELTETVKDSFEAFITSRNAYNSMQNSVQQLEKNLKKAEQRNRLGDFSYDELSALQEEYEDMQLSALDSLADYSQLLYSFDRLTCGGLTKYLKGENLTTVTAVGGNSYIEAEEIEGAYYYIQSKAEDNLFVLGVSIPEDFEQPLTAYELWVNGIKIGERTEITKEIRHLTLALENSEEVKLRFYDGDKFVDDCVIDAGLNRGELIIIGDYKLIYTDRMKTAASYTYFADEATQTVRFSIKAEPGEGIAYYQLTDKEGRYVYTDELVPITEDFHYLGILSTDLSLLKAVFYDSGRNLLYEGIFHEKSSTITVPEDILNR